MSLTLLALIAWAALSPLAFLATALLLPRRLHRRATARLGAPRDNVVALNAVRERRAGLLPTGTSRAL